MVPKLTKPLFLSRSTQDCIMLCHAADNVLVRRIPRYKTLQKSLLCHLLWPGMFTETQLRHFTTASLFPFLIYIPSHLSLKISTYFLLINRWHSQYIFSHCVHCNFQWDVSYSASFLKQSNKLTNFHIQFFSPWGTFKWYSALKK